MWDQPAVQQPSLASLMHARLYAGGFDKKPRNVATTINAAKEGRGRTSHGISAIAFVGAATPDTLNFMPRWYILVVSFKNNV